MPDWTVKTICVVMLTISCGLAISGGILTVMRGPKTPTLRLWTFVFAALVTILAAFLCIVSLPFLWEGR